jgi:Skp family chaperone for outer membrane proteins
MTKNFIATMGISVLCLAGSAPAFAGAGSAQTVPIKMGYFNLVQIKTSFPQAAAATTLEERAKELLRKNVEDANKQLVELQKQNKPSEEIEKQHAMASLLSNTSADANRSIAQAVLSVAKEKGLDIIIDASGIYAGGDKFASSGEDVTEAVLKRLVPTASATTH